MKMGRKSKSTAPAKNMMRVRNLTWAMTSSPVDLGEAGGGAAWTLGWAGHIGQQQQAAMVKQVRDE